MTSGNRVRTAVLAVVLVCGTAACADGGSGAPGSVAAGGPERPAAGGGDLVVDPLPLQAPVVLDPVPDGLLLTGLSYLPPEDDLEYAESPGDGEPARATLYGDPDLADTLDGPVLLVGTSSGSASIAGPPYDVAGEREVELDGRTARVVPNTDRTWVVFESSDYTEFVVGRGVAEEELVAAARGADFGSATTTLAPDAVPEGLEPLVAGGEADRPGSFAGLQLFLQGDSSAISVDVVRADPRLAALWGFWAEDATGTYVRGHPGSAGDLQDANVGDRDARGRIWAEDGMVWSVVVTQYESEDVRPRRTRDELLDEVVDDLRVGTWEEFEALDDGLRTRPPTREEAGCGPEGEFVSGVEGTARWSFQLVPGPSDWSTCYLELGSGGGGGGSLVPPPLGELAVSAGGGTDIASGTGHLIVGGVAPPGTARVTVTAADGRTRDAVLADGGPRPGERVWGTCLPLGPSLTGSPPSTATAYDAAGAVLASSTG